MTMILRPATLADVPRLVAMGRDQVAATYGAAMADNPAQVEALITALVTGPASTVFVAGKDGLVVGMIGLVAGIHHVSGLPFVAEIMWWMDPGARGGGLALLQQAEAWARAQGATAIHMGAPAGSRIGVLYERRGYRAVETTYQRAL